MRPTGSVLVAVKRVTDDEPFALAWCICARVSGTRWLFKRPRDYKRGGKGVHYNLLEETYRPFFREN